MSNASNVLLAPRAVLLLGLPLLSPVGIFVIYCGGRPLGLGVIEQLFSPCLSLCFIMPPARGRPDGSLHSIIAF